MTIEIVAKDAMLGAEIQGLDITQPISNEDQATLRAALTKHLVLLFRGQSLTVDEQVRFAQAFGDLGAIADTLLGLSLIHI